MIVPRSSVVGSLLSLCSALGCSTSDLETRQGKLALSAVTDTGPVPPRAVLRIAIKARPELVESSGAALSATQPGVIFLVNDSGNDPLLFAVDTAGADRGVWRVGGARNTDWEAVSVGPCAGAAARQETSTAASPALDSAGPRATRTTCVYLGDVGDNDARRATRVIYRVPEPAAEQAGYVGEVAAEALVYRYSDRAHDVEAMYVAPNGSTFLITKRRLTTSDKRLRPSLVFELPAASWASAASPAVAALVDSLPIVPGSASRRQVTDAALSPDGRSLAVRTYAEVYVFATDSTTGRVDGAIPPSVCDLAPLGRWQGEGVAWFGRTGKLVLTSEGRGSPMFAIECPMPRMSR